MKQSESAKQRSSTLEDREEAFLLVSSSSSTLLMLHLCQLEAFGRVQGFTAQMKPILWYSLGEQNTHIFIPGDRIERNLEKENYAMQPIANGLFNPYLGHV